MTSDDVTVTAVPIGTAPDPPAGRRRLLVHASVALAANPDVTLDGLVVAPDEPRKRCEAAIERAAAVVATYRATGRSISSPIPWIALIAESDADRAFLAGARGMDLWMSALQVCEDVIDPATVPVAVLSDRMQGAALLADAQSQGDPLAMYRELVRFFELAFALPFSALGKKLAQFLSTGVCVYERKEVEHWFAFRHAAVHGDGRRVVNLVVQADVRRFIQRMLQAARDTLFNKTHWHQADQERRNTWRPETYLSDTDGTVRRRQSSTTPLRTQLLDNFGAYPVDLSAVLTPIPERWWCPNDGSLVTRDAGQLIVEP